MTVFPDASVYGRFTLTLAFQLQNWGNMSELGLLPLRLALGPRLLHSKQTQIQILNIHKNQNGDIFDLLPTSLTFFVFFKKIKLLEYGV